jgi:hypothetical protein
MKLSFVMLVIANFLLTSCVPPTPVLTSEILTIQYTPASAPWLGNLYECADHQVTSAQQRFAGFLDPSNVELVIRLGEPADLDLPSYQVGNEDLLIIVNPQNPITSLTTAQARCLFTGQIQNWLELGGLDQKVHVWVFSSDDDIWQFFSRDILAGSPVTSTAHLAASLADMSHSVGTDIAAIGLFTLHLKTEEVSSVYNFATVPVLAITSNDPGIALQRLISCLQRSN